MMLLSKKSVATKKDFKRVTMSQARKMYNEGHTIYIVPSKVYPSFENVWIQPYKASKKDNGDFDNFINHYEYYNCNKDLGRVANFYI